jgi:hypothetical protein
MTRKGVVIVQYNAHKRGGRERGRESISSSTNRFFFFYFFLFPSFLLVVVVAVAIIIIIINVSKSYSVLKDRPGGGAGSQ